MSVSSVDVSLVVCCVNDLKRKHVIFYLDHEDSKLKYLLYHIFQDNSTSLSTLTFHDMTMSEVGRYKCVFSKTTKENKDKWAYGFYTISGI